MTTLAASTEADVPMSVAAGRDGVVYFGELWRVRAAGPEGARMVVEEQGFTPQGLALDGKGNVYVADVVNGRVRRIEIHE